MSARINKYLAALASIVLLVAAAPVYSASASDALVACNSPVCGG
jgi:hypothetical protein